MKYRKLELQDLFNYGKDILRCYECNHFVLDEQSPIIPDLDFVRGFVDSPDSMVIGVFDDKEKYLYGLIIFDNIRFGNKESCAEVHIINDKAIWGRKVRDLYTEVLNSSIFTTLYCQIPQIAVAAIALCKRLGFKKTGYIPNALPYTNSRGEENMYDINIMCWRKDKN